MVCINKISKVATLLFYLATSHLFISGGAFAVENPYADHFPFNAAIIHFEVKGHETGKETLYIKPGFRALYIDTEYSFLGKVKPKKVLILTTPGYIHTIDLIKKSGSKIRNFKTDLMLEFDVLSEDEKITTSKNVKELGTAVLGNLHGKKSPQYKRVLEIDCDLIEVFGKRALIWPGVNIILERNRESEYGEKSVATAVKIDQNVPVPAGKFEIPEGVLISLDKNKNELIENKTMTQFHSMRTQSAAKMARERIARKVILQRIELRDVVADIPEEKDDSIFADQETLNNKDVLFEIIDGLDMTDDEVSEFGYQ